MLSGHCIPQISIRYQSLHTKIYNCKFTDFITLRQSHSDNQKLFSIQLFSRHHQKYISLVGERNKQKRKNDNGDDENDRNKQTNKKWKKMVIENTWTYVTSYIGKQIDFMYRICLRLIFTTILPGEPPPPPPLPFREPIFSFNTEYERLAHRVQVHLFILTAKVLTFHFFYFFRNTRYGTWIVYRPIVEFICMYLNFIAFAKTIKSSSLLRLNGSNTCSCHHNTTLFIFSFYNLPASISICVLYYNYQWVYN